MTEVRPSVNNAKKEKTNTTITRTVNDLKAETSLAKGCLTTVRTKVGGESADFNSKAILGDKTSGNL